MPEHIIKTTSEIKKDLVDHQNDASEHTCACGEKHEHHPGTPGHRESCTSPQKFGPACCCGSGQQSKGAGNPCGHGPGCH